MRRAVASGSIRRTFTKVTGALVLGTVLLGAGACAVGVGYDGAYSGDYPPDAYIATTAPVYFDGRATYWYGGRWYYRDGASWRHYDREPAALYQRRIQAAPVRRNFEVRPAGRVRAARGVARRRGR